MITTRLTDYYYNLLHDIKAAEGRVPKAVL